MGQECNISVIYDRFFYTDTPIFAIFARPGKIPYIFRSKNKKTFPIFLHQCLLRRTQHGRKWPESAPKSPENLAAQEKNAA